MTLDFNSDRTAWCPRPYGTFLSSGLTNQMMHSYPVLNCIILLSQLFQTLFELFFLLQYMYYCCFFLFIFLLEIDMCSVPLRISSMIKHEWKDCLSFLKTYDVNIFRGGGGSIIYCAPFLEDVHVKIINKLSNLGTIIS